MNLVTGGTGLLGSHLIYDLLRSNEKVRAIKRPESDLAAIQCVFRYAPQGQELYDKIEWKEADVLDIYSLHEAMNEVTSVYHCAAAVSFNPKARERVMKVNVEGTANVVNACLEKGIKKLCYASSVAAIGLAGNAQGNGTKSQPATEDTPWKISPSLSNYSISKHAAEQEVWRGMAEGLNAVIVNPSIIIGPGNWKRSSTRIFWGIWKGMNYYTCGINGYIDVRDVSGAMINLMNGDIANERFILSSENLSYKTFLNLIAMNLGKKKVTRQVSPLMVEIVWRIEKARSWITHTKPMITKEIAREAILKRSFSSEKFIRATGMKFTPVEEFIKHTAQIFLSEMQKKAL